MSDRPEWPGEDPDERPDDRSGAERSRDEHATAHERPRTPLTQQIGRVVVLVLLAVFVVFAVSNSQRVDFSWVFGDTEVRTDPATDETTGGVPLIVLLLVAFVIGALVGAVLTRTARRRRTRAAEREAD